MESDFNRLDLNKDGILTVEEVNTLWTWYAAEKALLRVDLPSQQAETMVRDLVDGHSVWINLMEGRQKRDPSHRAYFPSEKSAAGRLASNYMDLAREGRILYRAQLETLKKDLEVGLADRTADAIVMNLRIPNLVKNWAKLELWDADQKAGVTREGFERFKKELSEAKDIPRPDLPTLRLDPGRLQKARSFAERLKKEVKIEELAPKAIILQAIDRLTKTSTGIRLLEEVEQATAITQLQVVLADVPAELEGAASYNPATDQIEIDNESFQRFALQATNKRDLIDNLAACLGHELYHALRARTDAKEPCTCAEETVAFGISGLIFFELGATVLIGAYPLIRPQQLSPFIFNLYSGDLHAEDGNPEEFLRTEARFQDPAWKQYIQEQWESRFPREDPQSFLLETTPVDGSIDPLPFVVELLRKDRRTSEPLRVSIEETPGSREGIDTQTEAWAIRDAIPIGDNLDDYDISIVILSDKGQLERLPVLYEGLKKLIAQDPFPDERP